MSASSADPSVGGGSSIGATAFTLGVWALALLLLVIAGVVESWHLTLVPLVSLAAVATASSWLGSSNVLSQVRLAAGHVVVLAAVVVLGALGAGLVGLVMTVPIKRTATRMRLFNMAMWACVATTGGLVYAAVGGARDIAHMGGPTALMVHVGVPLAVTDVTLTLVNAVLLAGVLRAAEGVPFVLQVSRLLSSTGLAYVGYGIVAFLLVVLWIPIGLGPSSILLIAGPLLGAWWAYRQYGEELAAHERALGVLVAAVETKAPHLQGHSARVATLSAATAEELGLGPGEVSSVRVAGMLHDLGQVALPTSVVHARGRGPQAERFASYPRRGAEMLRGLTFLAGSLDGIAGHRDLDGRSGRDRSIAARVVGVVDRFDLMTTQAGGDEPRSAGDAVDALRADDATSDDRVIDALERAVVRTSRPQLPGR